MADQASGELARRPRRVMGCNVNGALVQQAEFHWGVTTQTLTRQALDCRKPSRSRIIDRRKSCDSPDTMSKNMKKIELIQKLNTIPIEAVRCSHFVSTFWEYCGAYSHMKMAKTPDIQMPTTVSISQCTQAAKGHLKIGNEDIFVTRNQPIYLKYLQHGSVDFQEGNVFCKGATIQLNGETHQNILVYKAEFILVEDVKLEYSPLTGNLADVTSRMQLSFCKPGIPCLHREATYIYETTPNLCPF